MRTEDLFTGDEMREIERRVAAAEGTTSGEIVPYVVDASDPYPEAAWRAATLGAFAGPLVAWAVHVALHHRAGAWAWELDLWILLPVLLGAVLCTLLARFVEPFRRALVPDEVVDRRVRLRAAAAFVDEEVFDTRERTGILIFVSLFEHRVLVVADAGIEAKVAQTEWDSIAGDVAAGIRAGRAGEALAEGVTRCGELLHRSGVEIRPDDADELPDHVRTETP